MSEKNLYFKKVYQVLNLNKDFYINWNWPIGLGSQEERKISHLAKGVIPSIPILKMILI